MSGEKFTKIVLKKLVELRCGELFIGRNNKGDDQHYTNKLFKLAPCSTTIIRPGKTELGRIKKVLIPCSGGPHALDALKHAHLLSKSQGTHIHPLIVKPKCNQPEVMEEVGLYQLQKLV